MPEIIDITPVSSHTTGESEPLRHERAPEPEGRLATGLANLKRRLLIMGFVFGVVAAVAIVVSVGLLIFFALLTAAALLTAWMFVRGLLGKQPPSAGLPNRR